MARVPTGGGAGRKRGEPISAYNAGNGETQDCLLDLEGVMNNSSRR